MPGPHNYIPDNIARRTGVTPGPEWLGRWWPAFSVCSWSVSSASPVSDKTSEIVGAFKETFCNIILWWKINIIPIRYVLMSSKNLCCHLVYVKNQNRRLDIKKMFVASFNNCLDSWSHIHFNVKFFYSVSFIVGAMNAGCSPGWSNHSLFPPEMRSLHCTHTRQSVWII